MPIRITNFAGKFGWNARKYFPKLASETYLKFQFLTRGKIQQEYIKYFMESPETTYFRKKYNSLSSAWRRFTVLFGMGRSGSTLLWPPGLKLVNSE